MRPKLYVVVGSHPCAAVEAALELKAIEYDRVELPTLSQLLVGRLRFGAATVPGMRIEGEGVAGSRAIMRRLDELAPEPSLLPADDLARARVLEAERWGEEVFQDDGRRIIDAGFLRRPSAMAGYAADAKVQLPAPLLRVALPITARMLARRSKTNNESAPQALAELPGQLDRVDTWIAEGLLGDERPNCADLQIGSTVRLLLTIADVVPFFAGRPAAGLARYFPPMPGEIEAEVLPAEWLPGS